MKTEWDYTALADAYLKRADYSAEALDELFRLSGVKKGSPVADIGAGVAHLTIPLAQRGFEVSAVEPNDAMRKNGSQRTKNMPNVRWSEGVGEATGLPSGAFELVTFGSSFNVTDRPRALLETKRLLKPRGWFACMWNHRDLEDPIQKRIEQIIKDAVPSYDYGSRREDQTAVIDESKLFEAVKTIEGKVHHEQTIEDCVEAWRSHATLERQCGPAFPKVVTAIDAYLKGLGTPSIQVPYTTRIWTARLR